MFGKSGYIVEIKKKTYFKTTQFTVYFTFNMFL